MNTTHAAGRPQPTGRAAAWLAGAAMLLPIAGHAAPASWIGTAPSSASGPVATAFGGPQRGQAQLELPVSAHAHVFYEPKPWQPDEPAPSAAGLPPPRASLGLGFKTAPSGAAGMKGLLRVQLSSDSALHFRPRGGGLTVTYKAQF